MSVPPPISTTLLSTERTGDHAAQLPPPLADILSDPGVGDHSARSGVPSRGAAIFVADMASFKDSDTNVIPLSATLCEATITRAKAPSLSDPTDLSGTHQLPHVPREAALVPDVSDGKDYSEHRLERGIRQMQRARSYNARHLNEAAKSAATSLL